MIARSKVKSAKFRSLDKQNQNPMDTAMANSVKRLPSVIDPTKLSRLEYIEFRVYREKKVIKKIVIK